MRPWGPPGLDGCASDHTAWWPAWGCARIWLWGHVRQQSWSQLGVRRWLQASCLLVFLGTARSHGGRAAECWGRAGRRRVGDSEGVCAGGHSGACRCEGRPGRVTGRRPRGPGLRPGAPPQLTTAPHPEPLTPRSGSARCAAASLPRAPGEQAALPLASLGSGHGPPQRLPGPRAGQPAELRHFCPPCRRQATPKCCRG